MLQLIIAAAVASLLTNNDVLISKGGISPWSATDGLKTTIVQAPEGRAITVPSIASDGKTMVFGSNPDGEWTLFTAEVGSREWHKLAGLDRSYFGKIALSPKGDRIVYEVDGHTVGENHVHVFDLATNESQRLTEEDGVDLDPAWSPNGKQLAVSAMVEQSVETYADMIWVERVSELELINVESGKRKRLTEFRRSLTDPMWSPDGSMIAFVVDQTLHVISIATGESRELVKNLTPGAPPRWSPDGASILIAGHMADSPRHPNAAEEHERPAAHLLVVTVEDHSIEKHDWPTEIWHYDWHSDGVSILATGDKRLYRKRLGDEKPELQLEGLDFCSVVIRMPQAMTESKRD